MCSDCGPDKADLTHAKPKVGLIVEDETLIGGTDAATGAPVIRPKAADGRADESTKPTDARESRR